MNIKTEELNEETCEIPTGGIDTLSWSESNFYGYDIQVP